MALLAEALVRLQAASTAVELLHLQMEHARFADAEETIARIDALTPLRSRAPTSGSRAPLGRGVSPGRPRARRRARAPRPHAVLREARRAARGGGAAGRAVLRCRGCASTT
jgi:hypothetical protein